MKKVFFIVFLFSFCGSLFSQNSQLDDFSVTYYKKTVKVKECKQDVTLSVTYINDNNYLSTLSLRRKDGYFGFPDILFTVYVGDIRIKDFVVTNDTVFFCGTYKDSKSMEACIGFFNIDTLFNAYWNTQSGWQHFNEYIYVQKGFETKYRGRVSTLDKLIAYYDKYRKRHVVCIGQAETEADELVKRDCMVDFSHDGNMWSYNSGILNHYDTNSLEAIAFVPGLLDDYVVTAGFEIEQSLTIRLYNPHDVFSLPLSNIVSVFNDFSATEERLWKMNEIEIAPDAEGSFVTASVWKRPVEILPLKNRIHLARFSTYGLYNNYPGSMTWSRDLLSSNAFPNITGIHGLVSNSRNESYGLLLESERPFVGGDIRSFFVELDGTMDNILFNLRADGYDSVVDLKLRGLDLYDGGNKYIMAGSGMPTTFNKIIHLTETTRQASTCLPSIVCELKKFEPVKCNKGEREFESLGGRVTIEPLRTAFETTGRYRICPVSDEMDE